jgi:pimeloyl-ACP methyl ester carboxylesterase
MNDNRPSRWVAGLLAALSIANVAALGMSYRALSLGAAGSDAAQLADLRKQVESLRTELKRVALDSRPPGPPGLAMRPQPMPLPANIGMATEAGPGGGPPSPAQSPEEAGAQPPRDQPSPTQIAAHRTGLIERNASMHEADRQIYGDGITSLYEAARAAPGTSGSGMSSENAFNQLLSQYPNSNATGMAIAERAMQAAGRANTTAVEKYYNMLTDNANLSGVVTDSGVEATPALQTYLANQYVQQGQTTKAETVLNSLEQSHSNSLVALPGNHGDAEWHSVSEVVSGLRNQMNGGGSGAGAGAGPAPGGGKGQ